MIFELLEQGQRENYLHNSDHLGFWNCIYKQWYHLHRCLPIICFYTDCWWKIKRVGPRRDSLRRHLHWSHELQKPGHSQQTLWLYWKERTWWLHKLFQKSLCNNFYTISCQKPLKVSIKCFTDSVKTSMHLMKWKPYCLSLRRLFQLPLCWY